MAKEKEPQNGQSPKLITIIASSNTPREISQLLYEVTLKKKEDPQAFILAKSPRANKALIETFFAAGASAWVKLASPEEGPPEPSTE